MTWPRERGCLRCVARIASLLLRRRCRGKFKKGGCFLVARFKWMGRFYVWKLPREPGLASPDQGTPRQRNTNAVSALKQSPTGAVPCLLIRHRLFPPDGTLAEPSRVRVAGDDSPRQHIRLFERLLQTNVREQTRNCVFFQRVT